MRAKRGSHEFNDSGLSWRLLESYQVRLLRSGYRLALWPGGSATDAWATEVASYCYQLTGMAQNTCKYGACNTRGWNIIC